RRQYPLYPLRQFAFPARLTVGAKRVEFHRSFASRVPSTEGGWRVQGRPAMDGRLPWLIRDNPEYDPNLIGAITHAKVAAALVGAGYAVLGLYVNVRPYDLVIEDEEGRFHRVQC